MDRFVIISGCSGGGKSTLISELQKRGYSVVEEPGRRIVVEEQSGGGRALPWINLTAFAVRAIEMSLQDRALSRQKTGITFFDRGLVDAAAALEHASGATVLNRYAEQRYNQLVFLAPPWPEIYVRDGERKHDFDEAIKEYERLIGAFDRLDYRTEILPKLDVSARADLVEKRLGLA